jgi:hypothetical protein
MPFETNRAWARVRLGLLAAVAGVWAAGAAARGATIIGNYPPTAAPTLGIPTRVAVGFTMTASYTFESATIRALYGDASYIVSAGIYSDAGGSPGTLLEALTLPSPGPLNALADYNFVAPTPLALDDSTSYWFLVEGAGTPPTFGWATTADPNPPAGPGATFLGRVAYNPGPPAQWVEFIYPVVFQINGTAMPVPEPVTLPAFALAGLASWGLLRLRGRRGRQGRRRREAEPR